MDYNIILNDYYNNGYSKDWLRGYVHCMYYGSKKITVEEADKLLDYIDKLEYTK